MSAYTLVLDGLTAYGAEASSANQFRSIRGFATAEAARAWIAEQEATEARSEARSRPAAKNLSPIQLRIRNRELLRRAEEARRRAMILCGRPSVRRRQTSVTPGSWTSTWWRPAPSLGLPPWIAAPFELELQALLGEPETVIRDVRERLGLLAGMTIAR